MSVSVSHSDKPDVLLLVSEQSVSSSTIIIFLKLLINRGKNKFNQDKKEKSTFEKTKYYLPSDPLTVLHLFFY